MGYVLSDDLGLEHVPGNDRRISGADVLIRPRSPCHFDFRDARGGAPYRQGANACSRRLRFPGRSKPCTASWPSSTTQSRYSTPPIRLVSRATETWMPMPRCLWKAWRRPSDSAAIGCSAWSSSAVYAGLSEASCCAGGSQWSPILTTLPDGL